MTRNILAALYQPKEVLLEYVNYVEAKIEIGETPMYFTEWAEIEMNNNSYAGRRIVFEED